MFSGIGQGAGLDVSFPNALSVGDAAGQASIPTEIATAFDHLVTRGEMLVGIDPDNPLEVDRNKAALYRLYNRELRRNPTLQGQVVLRLTIEPDGSVSLCQVKSSDMKAPRLAMQVAERVKTFDFGAKEGISAITILYPIDFLPAI